MVGEEVPFAHAATLAAHFRLFVASYVLPTYARRGRDGSRSTHCRKEES
jgi:hypothetical protein